MTNEFERIPILPIKPLRIKKVPEAEERIMFKTLAWKTHKWVLLGIHNLWVLRTFVANADQMQPL